MNDAARASEGFEALELDELLARANALRSNAVSAVPHHDAVRLFYIEALVRRLQAASPAVQKVLQGKLTQALKTHDSSIAGKAIIHPRADSLGGESSDLPSAPLESAEGPHARRALRKSAVQASTAPVVPALSLLGELNQHIQTNASSVDADSASVALRGLAQINPQKLKSALRFRETWALISAETEVDKAAHRAPENAGPLNAHNLVLRTLSLMRELSPEYLSRFLNHTESLMWLDQAYGQLKQPAPKLKLVKAQK